MKKKIQVVFVVVVLGILVLPIITFDTEAVISEKENRNLADRPLLFSDNRLNEKLFSEYSQYFDDRFGGRQFFIALNDFVQVDLLQGNGKTFNNKAIKGRSGWFFYIFPSDGDNFADFYKINLVSEEKLENFQRNVENTLSWCNAQGIPCIFIICPNKHSVYSEFYPFERPDGKTRSDQLIEVLQEVGADYVFSRDTMIVAKDENTDPLYYETDTHWNQLGAYHTFNEFFPILQSKFPNYKFPQIQYEIKTEYSTTFGDILPMLGIEESPSTKPKLIPQDMMQEDLYKYIKNDDVNGVHTKGADETAPRALVFRDSFFIALEPFVSPLFSETEYIWKRFEESDKEYILEYKPDIIIFECVERYFPDICYNVK